MYVINEVLATIEGEVLSQQSEIISLDKLCRDMHHFTITLFESNERLEWPVIFKRLVRLTQHEKAKGQLRVMSGLCHAMSVILEKQGVAAMDEESVDMLLRCLHYCFVQVEFPLSLINPCCDLTVLLVQSCDPSADANRCLRSVLQTLCTAIQDRRDCSECFVKLLSECTQVSSSFRNELRNSQTSRQVLFDLHAWVMTREHGEQVEQILFQISNIVFTISTERIGCNPEYPFTCEWIVGLIQWGIDSKQVVREEYCLNAFQFLYMSSQSLHYQQALTLHASDIIQRLLLWLTRHESCHIQYFILRMLREWFDEASDHLIATRSVSAFVANMLEVDTDLSLSNLARYVLPLCSGDLIGVHPRVRDAAIQFLSIVSSMLSTTTQNMHFLGDYLQYHVIEPLVQKNRTLLEILGGDNVQMAIVKNMLKENRLVPCLVQSGLIQMVESANDLELSDRLDHFRALESESNQIIAKCNIPSIHPAQHYLLTLDKAQLELQRLKMIEWSQNQ